MNNGCVFFLIMLLYAIMTLSAITAAFGFIIYNGIFWGRIQGTFNFIPTTYGHLKNIWMLSLSTWNLGIIVPLIGPAIPAIINVVWTKPSACHNVNKPQFILAAHNETNFMKVWNKYLQKNYPQSEVSNWENSTWFNDWFYKRCNQPFIVNLTFLVIMILPPFIYALIKFITNRSNREGYDKFN
ncbi:hypothetical protein M9Y10_013079 [Tritrichomonas musculus]|uniref:Uncharacterized protein n=1 Tax=Tritrichomonas musculus TaxID=1915356 RepID=A0ABR2I7C0_9EUKA